MTLFPYTIGTSTEIASMSVRFSTSMLAPIVALALAIKVQATSFVSTGSTVMLNDNAYYYIPANPIANIKISSSLLAAISSVAGLTPLTVISTPSLTFNQADLDVTIANYTASDDVFQPVFLEGTLLKSRFALLSSFSMSGVCPSLLHVSRYCAARKWTKRA